MCNPHIRLPKSIQESFVGFSLIEEPVGEFGQVGVELAVEGGGVVAPGEEGGAGDVFVAVGMGVGNREGFWGGGRGGGRGEGGCLGWGGGWR